MKFTPLFACASVVALSSAMLAAPALAQDAAQADAAETAPEAVGLDAIVVTASEIGRASCRERVKAIV